MQGNQSQMLSFRESVCASLRYAPNGLAILGQPDRLLSTVLDICDGSSTELSVFTYHHEGEFLGIFSEAAAKETASALEDASLRGSAYLSEIHHIDKEAARQTCDGLAGGIADYLGLHLPQRDGDGFSVDAAWQDQVQAHETRVVSATGAGVASQSSQPYPRPIPPQQDQSLPHPMQPSQRVQPLPYPAQGSGPSGTATQAMPANAPAQRSQSSRGGAWLAVAGCAVAGFALAMLMASGGFMPGIGTSADGSASGGWGIGAGAVVRVSYETSGGTRIDPDEVRSGDEVNSPQDPERDGYDFVGWYEDSGLATPVRFPFVVVEDTVLYAKWEKRSVLKGAVATLRSDGHTYAIFDTDANWQSANSLCEELGGHLATITSQLEQGVVSDLVSRGSRNTYWIGGFLAARESWAWVTGEPFSYANWAEGTPDNWIVEGEEKNATEEQRNDVTSSENALIMQRIKNPNAPHEAGDWNDLADNGDCNGEDFFGLPNIGFVCEWDSLVE